MKPRIPLMNANQNTKPPAPISIRASAKRAFASFAVNKLFWGFIPFVFLLALSTMGTLFGASPMDPIYDLREARSLKPNVYSVPADSIISLFPVPQANSIGTNDLNNAITIFTFNKDRLRSQTYFKNAVPQLGGGGQFLPVISNELIGFAQTRRFLLYNFNTKTVENFDIIVSIEKTIEQVGIIDAQNKMFFFQIQAQNPESEDWHDFKLYLRLIDLSGKEPKLIKEMPLEREHTWSVSQGKLWVGDFEKVELRVFNSKLELIQHPLMDTIKRNHGLIDFVEIVVHPTLSFAILSGGKHRAQYVCWDQKYKDEKPCSLFGQIESTLFYLFSPDGRWVVFQRDESKPKRTYIMPVSDKYPHFLGSPILLEGDYYDRNNFAWTTNPVNLIGSAEGKLCRYDLTKEGHPECGDAPSYWDYVVDRDLEQLRKQGKQGLRPLKPEEGK